jgi:Asp-tRNA(Asn)/Glu-tRNA(Gln) amidotransferase A subunit family amidase
LPRKKGEHMDDLDLVYLSAVETLALFRRRELSPVELLDAAIEQVERCEPTLNAVIDRRYEEARAEASAAADRYASRSGSALPLDGLPVAAKEEHPMVGRSWSQGSLVFADLVADEDHPVIERVQAAGGVIHIRTATPEFCSAAFTESKIWGATRNPWNIDMTPGGSSGGSGAALAAGYAPLATGSDIGGSIRIPASFCGVVGFKPPFGRVPAMPPFNLDQYCHDGPMARSVADCALLENVIAGRHKHDIASLPNPPVLPLAGRGSLAGRRVALCINLGDFPVEPEIEANTRAAAAVLADAGAVVTEVTLPWKRTEILDLANAHFAAIMGASVASLQERADLLTTYVRAFIASADAHKGQFVSGMEREGRLYRPLGDLFEEHDALLCPTVGTRGLPVGEDYVDTRLSVAGVELEHYLLGMLTLPFNLFSRCPVLSVPTGNADNGVPTGAQLVGRTYDDEVVFELAYTLEAGGVGFHRRPTFSPRLSP